MEREKREIFFLKYIYIMEIKKQQEEEEENKKRTHENDIRNTHHHSHDSFTYSIMNN